MNLPLVVLAILAALGGIVVLRLPWYLYSVTVGMGPHLQAAAHAVSEGVHGAAEGAGPHHGPPPPWMPITFTLPTIASLVAAFVGAGLAWPQTEKFALGWSKGAERALGAVADLYEGALHAIFVVGGTRVAEALFAIVDRLMIDRLVELVGGFVNYLAESLRTLQTGYVRNYALVMLAGAVFVVACFMIILQQPPK